MCQRVTCKTCGKATYQGCGMHVEQVLAGVPASERCRCESTGAGAGTGAGAAASAVFAAASASADAGRGGLLSRLLGSKRR
ncbi:MAG TPA: hypothetical protein VL551_18525 [Actinospica sp.]|jgi:hypothetical protein|nr:hypothetical protein [Actinospica sp.]